MSFDQQSDAGQADAGQLDAGKEDAGHGNAADDTQPFPNLGVRVVQLFTSPAELFDHLRRRPEWLGAILLVIAISILYQILTPAELLHEVILKGLPPDATAEAIAAAQKGAAFFEKFRYVLAVVMPWPIFAAIAGLLVVLYTFLLGGEGTFRQAFAAISHVSLIPAIGSLLTLPLALAKHDLQLSLSLHLLAPGLDPGTYFYRVLAGLNVFGLWATVVLGIAVSRIYPKRSAAGSAILLLCVYVALKLLGALAGG